MIKFTKKKN